MGAVYPTGNVTDFYGEITKAEKSEYRRSYLARINPRSETEVRRGAGSALRRGGSELVGMTAGGAIGGLVPGKAKGIAGTVGSLAGYSAGSRRNIVSGDTRATEKGSGKKAKFKFSVPGAGNFWAY